MVFWTVLEFLVPSSGVVWRIIFSCFFFTEEVYQQEQHDKLSVLHCRLQQEADKIRKWKNAIELELQQKDRQLKDVQQLADAKQKSLLETQVRSEIIRMLAKVTIN